MKRIYITGDRSMAPMPSALLVENVLKDLIRQTGGDMAIGTGACANGIERAVRFLVPDEAMNLAHYAVDDEGNIDFERTFRELEPVTDQVVFLHMDPLSSHIGQALTKVFPQEKLTFLLQEILPV